MKIMKYLIVIICAHLFFSSNCGFCKASHNAPAHYFKVAVSGQVLTKGDTLILNLWDYFPAGSSFDKRKETFKVVVNEKKSARFTIPITCTDYGHFWILKKGGDGTTQTIFPVTIYEVGDDVSINIDNPHGKSTFRNMNFKYSFSGKGSSKYILKAKMDSAWMSTNTGRHDIFDEEFNFHDSWSYAIESSLKELDKSKKYVTPAAYFLLKADYLYGNSNTRFQSILYYYLNSLTDANEEVKKRFIVGLQKSSLYRIPRNNIIAGKYLNLSTDFASYSILRLKTLYIIRHNSDIGDSIYYYIKNGYKGIVRDYLITQIMLCRYPSLRLTRDSMFSQGSVPNNKSILNDALKTVKNKYFFEKLKDYRKFLTSEFPFESFSLLDTSGNIQQLGKLKGKVIFIDTWETNCGGCEAFYKNELSNVEDYYKSNLNIIFLSISADDEFGKWKKSLQTGKYANIDNPNYFVGRYGFSHPFFKLIKSNVFPSALLIDSTGHIVHLNTMDLFQKESLIKEINYLLLSNKGGGSLY